MNLLALSHYFQALDFQRKANQVVAILGGKTPHIQNLAVGGVMNAINLDSLATLNMDRLYMIKVALRRDRALRPRRSTSPTRARSPASIRSGSRSARACRNYLAVPDLPIGRASHARSICRADGSSAASSAPSAPMSGPARRGLPQGRRRGRDACLVQGARGAASLAGRDRARLHRLPGRRASTRG